MPDQFMTVTNPTLTRALALLQFCITLKLTAAVFGYGRPLSLTQWFSPKNTGVLLALSVLAPVYSLFTSSDPVQTVIWSLAGGVTAIDWVMVHAVSEGQQDIEELEKLKYDAKGA